MEKSRGVMVYDQEFVSQERELVEQYLMQK